MPIPQEVVPPNYKTAKERVLQTLYDWIINGVLEPGERIYDEELSKFFSVSRTPVREALQILAEKELVEILPARCTRVAPVNFEELEKIYRLISALHGLAVRMAFDRLGGEEISRLEHINHELRLLPADKDKFAAARELDRQFHSLILDLAANRYLSDNIGKLSLHIERAEILYFREPDDLLLSAESHEHIIAALKNRDLAQAMQATEENWMSAFDAIRTV